jgi:AcrR family transcriptional regulator
MDQQRQDRRSRRTQQALMEALLELLAVKNYDEISINDIVERANVGRSTFYAHYQDKDDLLRNGFERALDLLIQHVSFGIADQDLQLDATPLRIPVKTISESGRCRSPRPAMPITSSGAWRSPVRGEMAG